MGFFVRLLRRYIYSRFGLRVGRMVTGWIFGIFGLLLVVGNLALATNSAIALLASLAVLALGVGFLIWGFKTPKDTIIPVAGQSQPYGQYNQPSYPQQQPNQYGQPSYPQQQPNQYGQPSYPQQQPNQYGQYPQQPDQQNPYNNPY